MDKNNIKIALKASIITLVVNFVLAGFKLAAGTIGHSSAMISDAVHTLSDVVSTFIVIIGVIISSKKADKDHPYGHERFESIAALTLAMVLFITGLGIAYDGISSLFTGSFKDNPLPSLFPLIAALLSILIKEGMFWLTKSAAEKTNSDALMADAWHHRSDALSSIGSFVGIFGARIGFPALDSIACLVISGLIIKAAIDIFIDALNKVTDKSCDDETVELIRKLILDQDDVIGIDLLNTRLFGNKIFVDVEIIVDGNKPLYESHDIAHKVHDVIEEHFVHVKHCMVHVNPGEAK